MITYLIDLAFYWMLWSCAGIVLRWSMHEAGLSSLAAGAAMGFGAYAGILAERITDSVWFSFVIAPVATALLIMIFYRIYVRALVDDFMVASLGLQFVAIEVFLNARGITGGAIGITGVAFPSLFSDELGLKQVLLIMLILVLLLFGSSWLSRQPWRRTLNVMRESRMLAATLAKPVGRRQAELGAFVGFVLGLVGGLWTRHVAFAEASSFGLATSINVVLVVLCGGASQFGLLRGSAIVVLVPELLRFLPITSFQTANFRTLVFGVLLVGIVFYRTAKRTGDFESAIDVSL